MDRPQLLSMTAAEMEEAVGGGFRARQIVEWVRKGADFSEMSNLPKPLRASLAEQFLSNPVTIREAIREGETEKYLYALPDGNVIEGVKLKYHYGSTLCVSTQVGCAMGCAFCASTLDGCVRNLTSGEMLGQIVAVNRRLQGDGERLKNAVLMGSGEPLANYDNTIRFLCLLREYGMSLRGVSLSTCGLTERMRALAQEDLPVTLCVSLHAPNDEIRRRIMPIAHKYAMDDVIDACREYVSRTGRRVIFEYALIENVNCSLACADELASRLRGLQCHINLIPLNPVKERALRAPSLAAQNAFLHRLEQKKISVTRRRALGSEIEGACGQLRRARLEEDR
ncbi:MAG TPA: 23S rRNA (adenine(2503)-C(2))-methyltransferase RlmN [Candidatus Alectryocaccomicrobium excrementavium]|uniref:Probable dual-specificity RNA methyltransferase RlmN n=1 Tax=Candidatus Alectryocaccomicrobium excrementavium TaxID=2840668 RepID=A0A9D1K4X2_9FIRM|nr:23S rRNA (adenine(2503)-C(2))-methyltransferase RlmN [Candidatus Alectryocaccomicrobium excrementavium]